jgi:hypothetical protein
MPLVRIDVVEGRRTPEPLRRRLGEATGLAGGDLVVSLVGNTREHWSFGLGRAQFLEGDL